VNLIDGVNLSALDMRAANKRDPDSFQSSRSTGLGLWALATRPTKNSCASRRRPFLEKKLAYLKFSLNL